MSELRPLEEGGEEIWRLVALEVDAAYGENECELVPFETTSAGPRMRK